MTAFGISWLTVHDAFAAYADDLLSEPEPLRVLGIDETRRGRPIWVKDPDSGKWRLSERFETTFVDRTGGQGLLGQTAGRTVRAVTDWLDCLGQEWKDGVRVVATDPCATYRRAVQQTLPQAVIVADHFHVVRLANQALTGVRQRATRDQTGRRGLRNDPVWANRQRLPRGGTPDGQGFRPFSMQRGAAGSEPPRVVPTCRANCPFVSCSISGTPRPPDLAHPNPTAPSVASTVAERST